MSHFAPRRALYPDARPTSLRRFRAVLPPVVRRPARPASKELARPGAPGGTMKTVACAVMLAVIAAAVAVPSSAAEFKEIGVGVALGEPIGGSAKLWLDDRVAFDAGVGLSDGNAAFWGDVLFHDWKILPQPKDGRLGGYLGAGPQFRTGDDARVGIRTVAGVSWRPSEHPLELFAEAGPLFRLTQGGSVDGVGAVGVRVTLGGSGKR